MRRLSIVVLLALATAACASPSAEDVLDRYVAAYNAGDVDGMMDLVAPFALITGHPQEGGDVEGIQDLRRVETARLVTHSSDVMTVHIVRSAGAGVDFDHTIVADDGSCEAGAGHRILVDTGRIVRWDWPVGLTPCG